jgi:hypothetical protein
MAKRHPFNPLADDVEAVARLLADISEKIRAASDSQTPAGTTRADYVLIEKAAELTGYSRSAIEAKIARGQWMEGREWVKAPDGHRMISLSGYNAWVERGPQ